MVYQILRFSNIPLHHCACDTIANFFWILSHLTWPQGRRHGFWTGGAACPEKGPLAEGALFKVSLFYTI